MNANDYKNQPFLSHDKSETTPAGEGVVRRILSHTDEAMCVENTFETGAIGALHSHPHTQITYVVSGKFRFMVGDETYIVRAGDTLLKKDGIPHGCEALEGGILLDFFTPERKDFLE